MLSTLRKTLTVLFVLVGATVVMAACGGDDDAAAPAAKEAPAAKAPAAKAPDPTATSVPPTNTPVPATATPEPATGQKPAKWGGKLILAAHGPPSHFDFYASGTIANLGSQAGMYNQLIRRDPTDHTVPIIGDLAKEWEVSSDALKYTFNLEEGVKFHDGAEMTSADVVASYTRIVFPDETYGEGLGSARLATYEGIKEINAIDDYTVEFVMKGARNPNMIMQVFSLQWALISRAATLEKHEGNLREVDNHPGTGPYMYTERTDDHWVQDHNPDYWNMGNGPNGCPCIEQIEHIWLVAWTPELAAAMLGGVVDWAQWLDPKTGRSIGDNEGLNGIIQSIPVVSGIGWNIAREPYSDKRVRQAMALVIDGEAIIQATLDLKGYNFGEWFINGTPYAMDPVELRQTPGFRVPTAEDIAKAQQLIADAGFPGGEGFPVVDMLTRDTNPSRVVSAAVQSMIKEHLGIEGEIRIADVSGIAEEAQAGKFDFSGAGYGIILSDPSAYIGQGMKCGNTIGYCNETVDKLIVQLAEEADTDKRIAIVDEMRDIFLDEWPMMPFTAGESVFWGYWDHLKGLIDGSFTASYEMYRWDNVWLER